MLLKRRGCGPCVGTFPFTPLASATMKDQAPKDDLEGWFYMIMEVFLGMTFDYQVLHPRLTATCCEVTAFSTIQATSDV
ncbi:hypothetical protein Y032_0167g128 [Ancylostoma ceylanicum]|uniref:Protein kinase domain-containing protein n=1 Tax=Ancylostoma ceylanicum TaxID=53326 RepID=A0A016SWL4_9BILA|nr:hypothetical protein Y032_0167g128 [Ancylostoma ceylanicum]